MIKNNDKNGYGYFAYLDSFCYENIQDRPIQVILSDLLEFLPNDNFYEAVEWLKIAMKVLIDSVEEANKYFEANKFKSQKIQFQHTAKGFNNFFLDYFVKKTPKENDDLNFLKRKIFFEELIIKTSLTFGNIILDVIRDFKTYGHHDYDVEPEWYEERYQNLKTQWETIKMDLVNVHKFWKQEFKLIKMMIDALKRDWMKNVEFGKQEIIKILAYEFPKMK